MTFADLLAAKMNYRHRERVREGKAYKPEDIPEWLLCMCELIDVYKVLRPGESSQHLPEATDPEPPDFAELGIGR